MPAGSSIVNICSVAAMAGHAAAACTSSKWALRGLTRTVSLELGARGIRVNAVMPGLVDTPLMASASPAFTEAALAEIPLGRVGVPADIALTIVFLVSDDCADPKALEGAAFRRDRGWANVRICLLCRWASITRLGLVGPEGQMAHESGPADAVCRSGGLFHPWSAARWRHRCL